MSLVRFNPHIRVDNILLEKAPCRQWQYDMACIGSASLHYPMTIKIASRNTPTSTIQKSCRQTKRTLDMNQRIREWIYVFR